MKYSHLFQIIPLSCLFLAGSSYADRVEEDFKLCAAAVLGSRVDSDTEFKYDLSALEQEQSFLQGNSDSLSLSDQSEEKITFVSLEMELTDPVSGENLGDVRCYLTNTGLLVGAEFVKFFPAVASNDL